MIISTIMKDNVVTKMMNVKAFAIILLNSLTVTLHTAFHKIENMEKVGPNKIEKSQQGDKNKLKQFV